MQIDQDVRKRLLKFDQPGRQPKRSKAFGDGDPDLARQRIGDGIAGAQQVERRRFHAFDRRNHQRAFVGQPGAMDIAGKQRGADLPLEVIDPPAHDIDRQFQPFGRGSEAAAPHDFQEHPGGVPVGQTAEADLDGVPPEERPFPVPDAYMALSSR